MFLLTKFWKLLNLGPHFYKKLIRRQESLMYHHQVLCEVWLQIDLWLKKLSHFQLSSQVKFVTFQTWLDLKFSGSSSFKLENLKLIMVKPDLTWTWNFKFKFKFSSFQGPCFTLYSEGLMLQSVGNEKDFRRFVKPNKLELWSYLSYICQKLFSENSQNSTSNVLHTIRKCSEMDGPKYNPNFAFKWW